MNKLLYFLLVGLFCCGWHICRAQQDAQFSQYMFNTLYYNPGYAGVEGLTTIRAIHRTQWLGYTPTVTRDGSGALNTQVVSFNTPILRLRSGFGAHIVNDNLGPLNNLEAQLSFAYQLGLGESKLSLGLRLGAYSQTIDFDKYRPVDPDDPLLANRTGRESQVRPDMALGAFFRSEKFYGGISFNHIIEGEFDFGLDTLRNPLQNHMVVTGGFDYDVNFNVTITPSFLVKSDLNTYTFDVGVIATFDENLWAGLSYRQSEAAIMMLGYGFLEDQSLKVGYAFDYVVQAQEAKQATSHEIMISYSLPVVSANDKKIIRTPRFRQ